MKTILIKATIPDTIPDPEFSIMARCNGEHANSFDEWEDVEFEVIELPTDEEITLNAKMTVGYDDEGYTDRFLINKYIKGAKYILSKLK
jgi:hypothetical protein